MNNKIATELSWENIEKIINSKAELIEKNYRPDIIIAIQRGGWIPSVILSHRINVREIISVDARITLDDTINSPKALPIIQFNPSIERIKNKRILIVDDIIGSGKTYNKLFELLISLKPTEIRTFVCAVNKCNWYNYNKYSYSEIINYIGIVTNNWIVFPWEK